MTRGWIHSRRVPFAAALLPVLLSAAIPGQAGRQRPPREETAVFAGGCFWGVESVFEHVVGVRSATSGYSGTTGQVESVRVLFDPSRVTYRQLLQVFFLVAHDPTQRDKQGPDAGPEYRAIVFYRDSIQRLAAESTVADLAARRVFSRPIVTEIGRLHDFRPAEAFHQHYAERHPNDPYIVANDAPKLERLRQLFPALYAPEP
jgi:peptide-methionine (S)-S-oxide reductase